MILLVNPNRKMSAFYVREKSDTSSSRWISIICPYLTCGKEKKKPSEKGWRKLQKRFVLVCICEKTLFSSWMCQECQQRHPQK